METKQDQDTVRELRALGGEVCWRAVESRDASFDDTFVYGVSSTRVYCKPSCASRRARRERVRFFASCAEAEREGFRACRRCRPRAAASADPRVALVMRVCHLIETWDEGAPSLEELGRQLNVSPHHLQRTFKSATGITPRQYAAAHRLRQFKARMREGEAVSGAMYEAGYGSSSRLYEKAAEQLGMTPAVYGRGGAGLKIGYATAETSLGRVLVAATDRGQDAVSHRVGRSLVDGRLRGHPAGLGALVRGAAALGLADARLDGGRRRLGRLLGGRRRLLRLLPGAQGRRARPD